MKKAARAGISGCVLLTLSAWTAGSFAQTQGQRPPTRPPVFTQAQVAAGGAAYKQHCSTCHGAQLEGQHLAPSLTGERFDRAWRGKTADALMFHVRRMPPKPGAETGGLSDETYTNLLAYMLQFNGQAPGDSPLPSEVSALAALTIPAFDAPKSDADLTLIGSPATSARLKGLSPVTDRMLQNPPPADWLQWGRTYDGLNFSPLKIITKNNVRNLKPAFRAPLPGGTSMPTPVVHDGVMFLQTIPDTVMAIDGSNGQVLWRHQYKPAGQSSKKMGLALHGDRVFVPTSDLHVLALNARTGELLWNSALAVSSQDSGRTQYQLRSAPLIVGDKVIQGVTASFTPGGGFIVGLDIDSGKELWRFHTIARPDEPGGNTWNGLPLDKRSGGSVWHQGTYDPQLNLIYYGVAPTYDTGPLLHPVGTPGVTSDALFTNCTIALNPETGKLVWYYQHLANDQWDLDWVFERQIHTMTVDGRKRKVVMNVGKMAILDVLDAATGEYLFSIDAGTQNIITSIDPRTGAKTIDKTKLPDPARPDVMCPGVSGARAWPPTSYNPETSLLYLPLTEWCNRMSSTEGSKLMTSGVGISPAEHPDSTKDNMMGRLQVMDVSGRKLAWVHHQASPLSTSVLATAGGVVFSGDLDPALKAFDAATGKLLWQARLDDLPSSSVVTYSIGQTQYIAVIVGLRNNHVGDLFRTYNLFRKQRGIQIEAPNGGAAIWVFSL